MARQRNLFESAWLGLRRILLIIRFTYDWVASGLSVVLNGNQPDDLPRKHKRPVKKID